MSQVNTAFPDSAYTPSNKPSTATLKSDISALETAHNDTDTLAVKTTDTSLAATSFFLDEDAMGSDSATKVASQQSIKAYVDTSIATAVAAAKAALFPVGSIYVNENVATNPATLLGFGTWEAIEGEAIVGKASSGTFDTAGASVGSETVSIAHTHTGPSHAHTYSGTTGNNNATEGGGDGGGSVANNVHQHTYSGTTAAGGTANTGAMSANATPSVVQPSRVAYMWKRTA